MPCSGPALRECAHSWSPVLLADNSRQRAPVNYRQRFFGIFKRPRHGFAAICTDLARAETPLQRAQRCRHEAQPSAASLVPCGDICGRTRSSAKSSREGPDGGGGGRHAVAVGSLTNGLRVRAAPEHRDVAAGARSVAGVPFSSPRARLDPRSGFLCRESQRPVLRSAYGAHVRGGGPGPRRR